MLMGERIALKVYLDKKHLELIKACNSIAHEAWVLSEQVEYFFNEIKGALLHETESSPELQKCGYLLGNKHKSDDRPSGSRRDNQGGLSGGTGEFNRGADPRYAGEHICGPVRDGNEECCRACEAEGLSTEVTPTPGKGPRGIFDR
jgi:hypothetical protein